MPAGTRPASFKRYIRKVLILLDPDVTISGHAKLVLDTMIKDVMDGLVDETRHVRRHQRILPRDIQAGIKLLFPPRLAKSALRNLLGALARHQASAHLKTGRRHSNRAGLILSVSQVRAFAVEKQYSVGLPAALALAAVLEFIMAELLAFAAMLIKLDKRKRILSRDLATTIHKEPELALLFNKA